MTASLPLSSMLAIGIGFCCPSRWHKKNGCICLCALGPTEWCSSDRHVDFHLCHPLVAVCHHQTVAWSGPQSAGMYSKHPSQAPATLSLGQSRRKTQDHNFIQIACKPKSSANPQSLGRLANSPMVYCFV